MINWALRLQNKVTLTAICGAIVSIIFKVMAICGVAVAFSQSDVMEVIDLCIVVLMGFGIVTDPTTQGLADSPRAMTYDEPISGEVSLDAIEEENLEADEEFDELSLEDPFDDEEI